MKKNPDKITIFTFDCTIKLKIMLFESFMLNMVREVWKSESGKVWNIENVSESCVWL